MSTLTYLNSIEIKTYVYRKTEFYNKLRLKYIVLKYNAFKLFLNVLF